MMTLHPNMRHRQFFGALVLLVLCSACANHSTRLIKKYVSVNEKISGQVEARGGWYSESMTTCSGPMITTAWPLLNLTIFPLITTTGPWSDTFEAAQKKVVIHYSSTDEIENTSSVEVTLKMRLKNPMMIAEALSSYDYVDDVFDFVWERAASDMADDIDITPRNVGESLLPPFDRHRVNKCRLVSGTALPDFDGYKNGDEIGEEYSISQKKSYEQWLSIFLWKYGIGEIDVQLWAETRSPSGELLAEHQRKYSIRPNEIDGTFTHIKIN